MTLTRWLRSAFTPRPAARKTPARRLALERLEDRTTPSTGGLLDPTFGSGGVVTSSFSPGLDIAYGVLVQPDGKVVAAGVANMGRTGNDFLVARYNANGTLDATFGSGGRAATDFSGGADNAYAVALQPGTGGKLVVGGFADITQRKTTERDFALARYNANGTLDTTFGSNGKVTTNLGTTSSAAYAMAVQSDGRILLAGMSQVPGNKRLALARYTANGALDPTFGSGGKLVTGISIDFPGGQGHVVALGVQGDGRIVVAGTTAGSSGADFLLARFNPNGTPDTGFGGGTGRVTTDFGGRLDSASGLAIQSDGRIVVAGATQVPNSGDDSVALARYNPDGTLDPSFASGGKVIAVFPRPDPTLLNDGEAVAVAVQADGRIVVGGREWTDTLDGTYVAGSKRAFAERFNADGTVDGGYGPAGTGISAVALGEGGTVRALAVQSDGKVVFAGQTGSTDPYVDFALFRLLPSAPQIGSFTATPDPATAGSAVALAAGAAAGNPGPLGGVTQVAFYADSDGDGKLDPAHDTLLGYATFDAASGQWRLTISTAGWAPGNYRLFARATDGYGALGDPLSLDLQLT